MSLAESSRRSRRGGHSVPELALSDTRLSTWEERDRAHVELINAKNDSTIVEWWDEDVRQAVEDGFLDPRKMHQSAYDYAIHIGLIRRPGAREAQKVVRENPVVGEAPKLSRFDWNSMPAVPQDDDRAWRRLPTEVKWAIQRAQLESKWPDGRHAGGLATVHIVPGSGSPIWTGHFSDSSAKITVGRDWLRAKTLEHQKGAWPHGPRGRENPVEAHDFGDVDNALASGIKQFSATHYDFRAKGDLPRAFSPIPKSSGKTHSFLMWELFHQKGRYHWPREPKHVKKLPTGAVAVDSKTSVTYGPGWSEEARECGCNHGCSGGVVRENPVDVTDGIPWVKTERNAADFEEVRAIAEKVGPIKGSRDVYELMRPWAARQDKEHLCVVLLDIHSMLRGVAIIHIGQRDRVAVDPADVLKPAIERGAKGVCILHNHPSGSAQHSPADASLTKAIEKACDSNDIAFIDHVVMGSGEYYSFRDKKLHKVRSR